VEQNLHDPAVVVVVEQTPHRCHVAYQGEEEEVVAHQIHLEQVVEQIVDFVDWVEEENQTF
jgi:hypothetical protein